MKCSKCDREMKTGRVVSYCRDCRESDRPANQEILDNKRGLRMLAQTTEFTYKALEEILKLSKVPEDLTKTLESCLENGRTANKVAMLLAEKGFSTPAKEEEAQKELFTADIPNAGEFGPTEEQQVQGDR